MKEIKLYKSPIKSIRLLFLSSLLVLINVWLLYEGENSKIYWFGLFLFGIGFIIGMFNVLDRRPQIILNKVGIWDRAIREDVIKWEYIEDAYETDFQKQVFISIVTNNGFIKKKKTYSWASWINKKVGAQDLNLILTYINVDIEKLITLINILKIEPLEKREELIEMYRYRITS
jgi:hypothetical protein